MLFEVFLPFPRYLLCIEYTGGVLLSGMTVEDVGESGRHGMSGQVYKQSPVTFHFMKENDLID